MGLGHVARYAHVPAILETPGLELAAVFEPHSTSFVLPETTRLASTESAFFETALDCVVVTSPAPCHRDNIAAAADAGLPVLCEKPLADDPDHADQILAVVDGRPPLFVAYCYRFSSVATTIRDLLRDGAIGELKLMRLVYNWDLHGMHADRTDPASGINPRWHGRMIEGGPMVDCGVHQIDLAQWWSGSRIEHATGRGAWLVDYEAPSHVWGHLTHANGIETCVEMSYTSGHTGRKPERNFRYELFGTDGLIVFDAVAGRFEVKSSRTEQALPFANEKNFGAMYDAFARAVTTGEAGDLCLPADAVHNTRIAWQVNQSAIEQRSAAARLTG